MESDPASPACKTSALTTFFILFYLIMYVGITTLSTDSEPVQKSKLISCPSPTIYVALYLYISIRHVKIRRHQHFRRIQHNIIIVMWIKLTALKVLNNLTKLQSNLKLSKRKPHRLFQVWVSMLNILPCGCIFNEKRKAAGLTVQKY